VAQHASDTPLFSVVIPTYGRPQFLAEAIASVLAQTEQDFECVVVDDASPEPVSIPANDRIRLIRREANGGPAAARNTGLAHAAGRYATFLDDDDLYAPQRLALGLEAVRRAPIGICLLEPVGGVSRRLKRQYHKSENRILEGNVHDIILDRLPPHLGQVTIERPLMRELPFGERFSPAEDIEWWIRASERNAVATTAGVGYLLRRHPLLRQNFRHEIRIRTNLLIFQAHQDYFAAHPRAAAHRWRVHAKFADRMGDRRLAREALRRSLSLRARPSTLWQLVRSYARPVSPKASAAGPQSSQL
jgi:glycosyltransferase involved in cell wall biosynthesis